MEALDERMRTGHGQVALGGNRAGPLSVSDGKSAGLSLQGPQAGDDFPALGSGVEPPQRPVVPDPHPSPSRSESRAEQRAVGGWAQLLRPTTDVTPPDPSAQSGLQPHDAARGAVEGASGAEAGSAKARKAAATEQLLTEARRSVLDAMTGARGAVLRLPLSEALSIL